MTRPTRTFLRGGLLALAGSAFLLLPGIPVASGPSALQAQSLLASGGLGAPVGVPDARGRMLGGAGVGLFGAHHSPTDPAAAGRLFLGSIEATMESGVESEAGGPTTGRTRFPSFGVAYPHRGTVYLMSYSGVLGQEWRSRVLRTVDMGGESVDAIDQYEARGGIGAFRAGIARTVGNDLSLGILVGSYLGSLDRSFRRELDPSAVGAEVEPFVAQGRWQASGMTVTGSASWDALPILRVGAGITWSDELALEPVFDTPGGTVSVPVPLELRVGLQATLAPGLGLALSAERADWSEAAEALGLGGSAGGALGWGAGLEWTESRLRDRRVPLALGYRSSELPFGFMGEIATESVITGGFGIHLAETEGIPLARVSVGFDRGTRTAGDREESFLRTTVTFRLSGR
jgi:hypothetical protein